MAAFPVGQDSISASERQTPPGSPSGVLRTYDFLGDGADFRSAVLQGLAQARKTLPWEALFDTAGAQLFEQACAQPEYLAARIEHAILETSIGEIVDFVRGDCQYIDLGSHGAASAAQLIEHLRPSLYLPLDGSAATLANRVKQVAHFFPWLNICGLNARFDAPLHLPRFVGVPIRYKLVSLLGGAFARYAPADAPAVLARLRALAGPAGRVLVSVDQTTDWRMLQGAYNDRHGAMAAFNVNALAHINRELQADFQLKRYLHTAVFDQRAGCLEMGLESQYAQFAHVAGQRIDLAPGERIRTAIHCAYSAQEFLALAQGAGLRVEKTWCDTHNLLAVHCMVAT